MEQFAYFIDKLASTPDGDGTLLDHSMIVYGSGISDGNRHLHHDLPVLIVGKANGSWKTGRHVQYPKDTPMTNLFLAMLDRMVLPELAAGRFDAVANNERDYLACAAAKRDPNPSYATLHVNKKRRARVHPIPIRRRFISRLWRNQSFAQGWERRFFPSQSLMVYARLR